MMYRMAAAITVGTLLSLTPDQGGAETITARMSAASASGRQFILDVQPAKGWTVRQFAELIEVRFPGFLADIALPTAIRPPVSDLSTETKDGDTYLRFTVACDCYLAIAQRAEGDIVIDLVDRTVAGNSPAPVHAPIPAVRGTAAAPPADGGTDAATDPVDVAGARQRLMKQLLRAAEAGLIELDGAVKPDAGQRSGDTVNKGGEKTETAPMDHTPAGEAPVERPDAAKDRAAAVDPPKHQGDAANGSAKQAASGTKAATAGGAKPATEARPPAICHAAALFDLPRIGSMNERIDRIGQLRASLIGEFDKPDQKAVLDLARVYLSDGLSEEALALLAEFGGATNAAAVLSEVALVIAGKPLPEGSSLLKRDCIGPQALWRALAMVALGDLEGAMAAEAAAGRALEKLPPALRKDLGARLGLAAADAGQWDTARRLHALVARTGTDYGDTAGWPHLLAARLALWSGDEAEAIRALTAARSADPEVAALATLTLADVVLKSRRLRRVGIDALITDLSVLARLHRGTSTGVRAATLEALLTDIHSGRERAVDLLVLGLALGNFDETAFSAALSAMAEGGDAPARDSIAAIYLEDPAVFAPALTDARFRSLLALSLVRLGLPAQAAGLFTNGDLPDDVAVALAKGFIDVGDHRSAIALIADLPESPERDRLRRAAMERSGVATLAADAGADKEPPSPEHLMMMARAAIAAGDLQRALKLTEMRVQRDGGERAAKTAAMIALALGQAELPSTVTDVLKEKDPELHARLVGLFAKSSAVMDPDDPTTAAAFLKRLDAEIAVIEDVLDDG